MDLAGPSEVARAQAFASQMFLALLDEPWYVCGHRWNVCPDDSRTLRLGGLWTNTLLIPAYCAILSAVLILLLCLHELRRKSSLPAHPVGSPTILASRLVQLVVVLALLGISVSALIGHEDVLQAGPQRVIRIVQCVVYVRLDHLPLRLTLNAISPQMYVAVLGFLSTLGRLPIARRAYAHTSLILAVTWCVYIYRDVWPLATVTTSPADLAEGKILWAKIALLSLGGIVIPLLTPRTYVPSQAKVCTPSAVSPP